MKSSVENVSPVEKKILVELEPAQVSAAIDAAYRQLSRQVKIEGFRPGRVPRHILERKFKAQIEDEVTQKLVETSYREAVVEHKVDVVASPKVQPEGLKIGEPFRYQARVEVRPVIEPVDYTGLPVKRGKHLVGDAEVTAELEKIRLNHSQLVPVLDRDTAVLGDTPLIDFEAKVDGKVFPGGKGEGVQVEVKAGEFTEGKIAALEGMKVGTSREIDYTFPAEFRVEEVRGKPAKIDVKLKELKKRDLPQLDDELAKDTGLGATLAELKEKILKQLKADADNDKRRETRDALVKGLIAKNPFECPPAMIDRSVESMVDAGLDRLSKQGIDVRKMGLNLDTLRQEVRPKAEEDVRGALLLDAIARKESITPNEADFQKRLDEIASENDIPIEKVKLAFKRPEQREGIMFSIKEEKTLAFLESKSNVQEE